MNAVRAAAAELPNDFDRAVLLLRYDKGLPWDKIADMLGFPTADSAAKRCARLTDKMRGSSYKALSRAFVRCIAEQ